jgi:hypothetical protein
MVSSCGRSLKKSFTTPEDSLHGILLSLWRCCMMLFHALSFCFRIEGMKPAFITCNDAVKTAYRFINYKETFYLFFFKLVLLSQKARNQAGTNFPVYQASHRLLDGTASCSSLCCHFPVAPQFSLINSLISPSFLWLGHFAGYH